MPSNNTLINNEQLFDLYINDINTITITRENIKNNKYYSQMLEQKMAVVPFLINKLKEGIYGNEIIYLLEDITQYIYTVKDKLKTKTLKDKINFWIKNSKTLTKYNPKTDLFFMAVYGNNKEMVIDLIDNYNININAINDDCSTALMVACKEANYDMVELLIEKGANVNAHNKHYNVTPLEATLISLTDKEKIEHNRIAILLIKNGANYLHKVDNMTRTGIYTIKEEFEYQNNTKTRDFVDRSEILKYIKKIKENNLQLELPLKYW